MEAKTLRAYENLVPADRLVIDAMIVSLLKKDKQIRDMCKEFTILLEKRENL